MSLIPYRRSFSLFDDLDNVFSGLYGGSSESRSWAPAVDIKENEDSYLVKADVPGVDPKDIEVTFDNGVLSISGERRLETNEENEDYKRVERIYGSFSRQFSLPDTVNSDGIKADAKNGVLEISIPKAEKAKPKRISVS